MRIWARRRKGYGDVLIPGAGLVREGEDIQMEEDEVRGREDFEVAGAHMEPEPVAPAPASTRGWSTPVAPEPEPEPEPTPVAPEPEPAPVGEN